MQRGAHFAREKVEKKPKKKSSKLVTIITIDVPE